jgi:hypothetical protein
VLFIAVTTPSVLLPLAPLFLRADSLALYQLICTGPPCRKLTDIGVDKSWASAKISLIFAKIQQSISLLTGVLSKIGKSKKLSPSLSNISFCTHYLHTEAFTEIHR